VPVLIAIFVVFSDIAVSEITTFCMKTKESPSYFRVDRTFFWIGLTAFGGVAMTAHIRKHIVDKLKWLDSHTFDSGLALCRLYLVQL